MDIWNPGYNGELLVPKNRNVTACIFFHHLTDEGKEASMRAEERYEFTTTPELLALWIENRVIELSNIYESDVKDIQVKVVPDGSYKWITYYHKGSNVH
jgi:hypothetical protein